MLRLVVPRGKRFFSGVLILCADGEVEGPRGEELQHEEISLEKSIYVSRGTVYTQACNMDCNLEVFPLFLPHRDFYLKIHSFSR